MKTKQLSFEFPYRSNEDGVVKLEQFLRQNLLEIEKKYIYDKDYKWELQKLKRDREDKEDGKVLDSFPGSVYLQVKNKKTILHPDYRRYEGGYDEAFEYFVTRLLARITPSRTNFRKQKHKKLLSEIFTVTDEAFVLFVLYNEWHIWVAQIEDIKKRKKGRDLVREKRFCNSKEGWKFEGMQVFVSIVREVMQRRKESEELEEEMRDRMNNHGNKKACEELSDHADEEESSTDLFHNWKEEEADEVYNHMTVSYTHLTLPTILLV